MEEGGADANGGGTTVVDDVDAEAPLSQVEYVEVVEVGEAAALLITDDEET